MNRETAKTVLGYISRPNWWWSESLAGRGAAPIEHAASMEIPDLIDGIIVAVNLNAEGLAGIGFRFSQSTS